MTVEKSLLGRISPEAVGMLSAPKTDPALLAQLRAIGDPSSTVSDVMDKLGIPGGAIGASRLVPTMSDRTIVGPAQTVRNVIMDLTENTVSRAARKVNGMAEIEAHNITDPGDVLVIEGVEGLSNMGGISAEIAKRQGSAGAIVAGGVRDVGHSRAVDYPVWASEIVPVTGKWRIETVAINQPVTILGVKVSPGDIVVADGTGVAFIPRDRAVEVITMALKQAAAEDIRLQGLREGLAIRDLPKPA